MSRALATPIGGSFPEEVAPEDRDRSSLPHVVGNREFAGNRDSAIQEFEHVGIIIARPSEHITVPGRHKKIIVLVGY